MTSKPICGYEGCGLEEDHGVHDFLPNTGMKSWNHPFQPAADPIAPRLQEIAERESNATEGPWGYNSHFHVLRVEDGEWGDSILQLPSGIDNVSKITRQMRDDMEFAAHSRADIPWLMNLARHQAQQINALRNGKLKEIERLEAELASAKEEDRKLRQEYEELHSNFKYTSKLYAALLRDHVPLVAELTKRAESAEAALAEAWKVLPQDNS